VKAVAKGDHSKPQPSVKQVARAVDRVFAAQERREAETRLLVQMQRTIKALRPRWLKGEGRA
jgi:hypothetical protein